MRSARPSTADSVRREITPWEFSPVGPDVRTPRRLSFFRPAPPRSSHFTDKPPKPSSFKSRSVSSDTHAPTVHPRRHQSSNNSPSPSTPLNSATSKSAPTTPKLHDKVPPFPMPHSAGPTSKSKFNQPPSLIASSKSLPSITAVPSPAEVLPPVPAVPPLPQTTPPTPLPPDLKFSTADRTILAELVRNIQAREAQFVLKGPWSTVGASRVDAEPQGRKTVGPVAGSPNLSNTLGLSRGQRHHPYSRKEVPYPRSYEREVLDLDVWETMFCTQLCASLTWHVFEVPPARVLDIGCGTGTWILDCARTWRESYFVGLDIVPLHPDLHQVGSSELASRITWVQANFLETLPFPNDEFDFIHVKRIARGVPEDKWDSFLEEVTRVMKPGAAFEMIEEDLYFPGKSLDEDSDNESLYPHSDSDYHHSHDPSEHHYSDYGPTYTSDGAYESEDHDHTHTKPLAIHTTRRRLQTTQSQTSLQSHGFLTPASSTNHASSSTSHVPLTIQTSHKPPQPLGAQKLLPPRPLARSTMSLLASLSPEGVVSKARSRVPSQTGTSTSPPASPPHGVPTQTPNAVVPHQPFLHRTLPKPPLNPRDHTLLEVIYTEMHSARFINLAPLALLANSLGLYFKDVRTHPPIQFTFPPLQHGRPGEYDFGWGSDEDSHGMSSDSDPDQARDAVVPDPSGKRRRKKKQKRNKLAKYKLSAVQDEDSDDGGEDRRWLTLRSIIRKASAYVSLEGSRTMGYSPSRRASFPPLSPVQESSMLPAFVKPSHDSSTGGRVATASSYRTRLPNATLKLDVRTLNLHLASRTAEILACAESMWEWVVEYQAKARLDVERGAEASRVQRARSGSTESAGPMGSFVSMSADACRHAILELTREDFDGLLSRFDMDMRDHMALGPSLEERFRWYAVPMAPAADRKVFEEACEAWGQWESQQMALSRGTAIAAPTRENSVKDGGVGGNRSDVDRGTGSHGTSTLTPPARRLCRSMRVFAAWKA